MSSWRCALRLDMLIGTLQSCGRESRIRAELGPDYDPATACARGLLSTMRRARIVDAAHDAKNIASIMLDARDEIQKLRTLLDTCEQQARDDERGRVLAAVADAVEEASSTDMLATLHAGRANSRAVDALLSELRAGRVPGGER